MDVSDGGFEPPASPRPACRRAGGGGGREKRGVRGRGRGGGGREGGGRGGGRREGGGRGGGGHTHSYLGTAILPPPPHTHTHVLHYLLRYGGEIIRLACSPEAPQPSSHVGVFVCLRVCVHVCVHVCVRVHVCVFL